MLPAEDSSTKVKIEREDRAINRLPAELLAEIFVQTCSLNGEYTLVIDDERTNAPPLSFSAVCSRWRAIALGYSPIWTAIHIGQAHLLPSAVMALELFLDRSNGSPLNLWIKDLVPVSSGVEPWRVLVANFHRCKKLVLEYEDYRTMPDIPNLTDIRITFPILTSFNGLYRAEDTSPFHISLNQAFVNAPKLNTFSTFTPFPIIPYSQLRSLTLYSFVDDEMFQGIIPYCRNLKHLCLDELELIEQPSITTILSTLKTLVVGIKNTDTSEPCWLTEDVVTFLSTSLSMPSLTTLKIALAPLSEGMWYPAFLAILGDVSATLHHLSITLLDLGEPPRLEEVMERVPHLRVLEVTILGTDGGLRRYSRKVFSTKMIYDLYMGSLSSETCRLVPELESFSFRAYDTRPGQLHAVLEAMVQVAEIRCEAGTPLSSIRLAYRCDDGDMRIGELLESKIGVLREKGMNVTVE